MPFPLILAWCISLYYSRRQGCEGLFLGGGGGKGDCSNGFPVLFQSGVDMGIGDTNSRGFSCPGDDFFFQFHTYEFFLEQDRDWQSCV